MGLSLRFSGRICFSDHKFFYFSYPHSPFYHLHRVLILCCVLHPVIQPKFHCCAPAASLISVSKPSQGCSCRKLILYICTYTQKVLLALEALRWNMSVKRLLETSYTMPKSLFCNYVNKISHLGIGQVYAGFLGCKLESTTKKHSFN